MMQLYKNLILGISIFAICSLICSLILHSDQSWKFQRKHFNYQKHTEIVNNVITFHNYVKPENIKDKIFGFGNSQMRSIFRSHKKNSNSEFTWAYIAAFRVCALPYYTQDIINAKPRKLILYLTDRDLNHTIVFHSLFHHPFSLARYLKELPETLKYTHHSTTEVFQILFSEVFFPLKFSYQFKNFLNDKLFTVPKSGKVKSFEIIAEISEGEKKASKSKKNKKNKKLDNQIKGLIRQADLSRHPELLNYNVNLFREFLERLLDNNIEVLIIEGQYHPKAMKELIKSGVDPHHKLNEIANSYESVNILPLEDQLILNENEYTDHVHFTKMGGGKLMNQLLSLILE